MDAPDGADSGEFTGDEITEVTPPKAEEGTKPQKRGDGRRDRRAFDRAVHPQPSSTQVALRRERPGLRLRGRRRYPPVRREPDEYVTKRTSTDRSGTSAPRSDILDDARDLYRYFDAPAASSTTACGVRDHPCSG